jgi:hypothetical protein
VFYTAAVRNSWAILFVALSASPYSVAATKPAVSAIRWSQSAANCTLRDAEDGRTYYGLSSGDFEVTLAVDRQELAKIPHRAKPMLGVFLTFRYKGMEKFDVQQNRFALEYTKHFQVVKGSLDPDEIVTGLQQNVDDLTDQVERHDVKKHPELKGQKETELQARLKDYTEMIDFISTRALKPVTLDPSNSSASGWVFFSTKDKWIGRWQKPEEFVLRLPVENWIVEFPFSLPPKGGKVELKRRPGE